MQNQSQKNWHDTVKFLSPPKIRKVGNRWTR